MKQKSEANSKSADFPFVTPRSMAKMMEYIRKPNWEHIIDQGLVKKLGVAPNNEPKVPFALRFLGIIDSAGVPTKEFGELKNNYQGTLKRLVKENYAELLSIHPPDMVTRRGLKAFFGKKQTDERRARFFIWLCKEAGIELPNLESEQPSGKSG